jgi:hypothetical protein
MVQVIIVFSFMVNRLLHRTSGVAVPIRAATN